jgi:hypothetical protein
LSIDVIREDHLKSSLDGISGIVSDRLVILNSLYLFHQFDSGRLQATTKYFNVLDRWGFEGREEQEEEKHIPHYSEELHSQPIPFFSPPSSLPQEQWKRLSPSCLSSSFLSPQLAIL